MSHFIRVNNMTDQEFLMWIHERLVKVYNEDPLYDYMRTLRAIIYHMDRKHITPKTVSTDNISELRAKLRGQT